MKKEKLQELIRTVDFLTDQQKGTWLQLTEKMDDILLVSYLRAFYNPPATVIDRLQKNTTIIEGLLPMGNDNMLVSTMGDNGISLLSDIKFYENLSTSKDDLNTMINQSDYMSEEDKTAMIKLGGYLGSDAMVLKMQGILKKINMQNGGPVAKKPLIMAFVGLPVSLEYMQDQSMVDTLINQLMDPLNMQLRIPRDGDFEPTELFYQAGQYVEEHVL